MSFKHTSSPIATGGAGTFFEQHVAAYWLALLLVRGIPPILRDCVVVEVHLQTEHLGWHTDDFLIVGQNGSGGQRKLVGQVKRTFTVSAANDECRKTFQDFWKDFKNSRLFLPSTDRFALVTLRGTNTLLEHFSGLLDCARASCDGAEFESRLATPGFISTKAVQYCDEIRKIIAEIEGKSVSRADLWSFLRVVHVLSLDLNSATCQTEVMIKTLLAHTTSEQDAMGAAEATWNALLREASEGMSGARSYQHGNLPEVLRQRHALLRGDEQRMLRVLNDHSALILDGIRSKIGSDLHLRRARLVQQVIQQLESTQVVLISGPAGSGKSVVAKDVIGILGADHFVFSFRAEEFAHAHFDETLQSIQVPANAAMLGAILASQDRKVLLVESIDRLLEKSTRDAFTDLLTLVARDKSWRLVLTCRDYATNLVRASFLEFAGVGHSVVTVPPLDDQELEEVKAAYPMLAHPLANVALRRLLRNPYILDKALQIRWSEEQPLPQSEWEFRALFWREFVRADHYAFGGMPRRREDTFVQIALRRARALTMYAHCDDLDPEVVDSLRRDSLIVSSQESSVLLAPAHDVLEDWALLHWIEEQYRIHEGSIRELPAEIGTHPAIRRTYRKWVTELVERNPDAADELFQAVLREGELPAHFRDDTLVSLLRSSSSATFLERYSEELFANDKQLLWRIIHLLRVACVTTPEWLPKSADHISSFNVPDGPAWASILQLVHSHLESFNPEERPLLLGLIEDWARGATWQNPYPEGAKSVAAIAHWLLPAFDDYRSGDERKRTLQVIAKIPNADRERFATLLQGHYADSHTVEAFREIVFAELDGAQAARDMPELFVSAAKKYLLLAEEELGQMPEWYGMNALGLEVLFGIRPERGHGFFPPSAFRGPYLTFLRVHSKQGLDFIIEVFNHGADWYAHPRLQSTHPEPPFEITLVFPDGTIKKQWGNVQLWNLYRGTSVGPYVLQCLLMALERWLLELAEEQPEQLDKVLLYILKRSDSAALTAVVASVATAYSYQAGETLLALLSSPDCFFLDHQRLVSEVDAPSKHNAIFLLSTDPMGEIYLKERKEADTLPHRQYDLETAILKLQTGPFASRVHELLDQYRAQMPSPEEQDDDDRLWRLALHRMDLRRYTMMENGSFITPDPEDGRSYFLTLTEPEPDLKEMVKQTSIELQATNTRFNLLMWGWKVFNREHDEAYDPAQWREKLQEAQTIQAATGRDENFDLSREGPGVVAAVCVRDHWDEMSDEEQAWCVNVVCSEVEHSSDLWGKRFQRNRMSADRVCAQILPILLGKDLTEAQRNRVLHTFVLAITHAIWEVRWYAAQGIGEHLWSINPDLALRCVNVLAAEAMMLQRELGRRRRQIYQGKISGDVIAAGIATVVRQKFFDASAISDDAYQILDLSTWFGVEAYKYILIILGRRPTHPATITAFERLVRAIVDWWDANKGQRGDQHEPWHERDYRAEVTLRNLLADFLLRTTRVEATRIVKPIVNSIDRHPDKVYRLVVDLIMIEDDRPNTPQFWLLWEQLAAGVRKARWLPKVDNGYAEGMISAIFLSIGWKKDVRHWPSLEGYAWRIDTLFEDLPPSSTALNSYVRFLYHIGEQSLPEAFICIADKMKQGNPEHLLRNNDTILRLEVLLQRYVYGKPLELKRQANLREAVLYLLDVLVESGSSMAFRMRDDFVTPIPVSELQSEE